MSLCVKQSRPAEAIWSYDLYFYLLMAHWLFQCFCGGSASRWKGRSVEEAFWLGEGRKVAWVHEVTWVGKAATALHLSVLYHRAGLENSGNAHDP